MRQTERKRKEKSALGSRQRIGDLYCKDISEWIYKRRRQNTAYSRQQKKSQMTIRHKRTKDKWEYWKSGNGTRCTAQGAREIQGKVKQRNNHENTKEEGGSCFRDEFLSLVFVFGLGSGALADG